MITDTFEALGTKWWIEIFDDIDEEKGTAVIRDCAFLAHKFNDTYSRFKGDSVISILNRERSFENPSEEYRSILTYGKGLYLRSDSTFNFLVGHVMEARGYDAEYSFTPKDTELKVCNPITDLQISESEITLTCGNVDLGGFGKGYLIDLMAEQLKATGIQYFLINGGGDMYATSDCNEPIKIYLEHPTEPGKYIGETSLLNQGFAASSPFKRQWVHEEQTYTHIVSETALEAVASFVKADTAAEADAFATTSLLLSQKHLETLASRENFTLTRFSPETNQLWKTVGF